MKIAVAQLNYHIGNFESNTEKIRQSIFKAKGQGVDIVIFAELAISGYPPRDFLEFDDFIRRCEQSIETIAKECTGIAAIVGAPSINPEVEGKHLFNSAWFLADGAIKTIYHKGLLPTYDVFDEYRYFESGPRRACIEWRGLRLGVHLCEDMWNNEEQAPYHLYTANPIDELAVLGIDAPTRMVRDDADAAD